MRLSDVRNLTYLTTPPDSFIMYYYNPLDVSDYTWPFVFSYQGRTKIQPRTTRFLYVGANGGDFTIYIEYGNTGTKIDPGDLFKFNALEEDDIEEEPLRDKTSMLSISLLSLLAGLMIAL